MMHACRPACTCQTDFPCVCRDGSRHRVRSRVADVIAGICAPSVSSRILPRCQRVPKVRRTLSGGRRGQLGWSTSGSMGRRGFTSSPCCLRCSACARRRHSASMAQTSSSQPSTICKTEPADATRDAIAQMPCMFSKNLAPPTSSGHSCHQEAPSSWMQKSLPHAIFG